MPSILPVNSSFHPHMQTKGVVTDFCSYYHLPSTVFKCDRHTNLGAVYSYYNVATTITYAELMNDALILARISGTFLLYCIILYYISERGQRVDPQKPCVH
jgi:hypothetical protein